MKPAYDSVPDRQIQHVVARTIDIFMHMNYYAGESTYIHDETVRATGVRLMHENYDPIIRFSSKVDN